MTGCDLHPLAVPRPPWLPTPALTSVMWMVVASAGSRRGRRPTVERRRGWVVGGTPVAAGALALAGNGAAPCAAGAGRVLVNVRGRHLAAPTPPWRGMRSRKRTGWCWRMAGRQVVLALVGWGS